MNAVDDQTVVIPPQSVNVALARVMAELPSIGKGDKAPQGYSYRGIEAITKHLQPLLAKHGVVIVPNVTINSVQPAPAMKDGWQDVYMTVEWTICGPDGSTITAQTTGIGRDNSDKGANKAQTQAFKYLVMHLFCIADAKDDADAHSYEHARVVFVSTGEAQNLIAILDGIVDEDDRKKAKKEFIGRFGVGPRQLPADKHDAAVAWVDARAATQDPPAANTGESAAGSAPPAPAADSSAPASLELEAGRAAGTIAHRVPAAASTEEEQR